VIKRILAGLRRVTSSGMYDARLDGLRALAILPVVLFHDALRGRRVVAAIRPLTDAEQALTDMVPRGEAGVMLFFFISGFIIAFPFLRAAARAQPPPSVGTFYKRRLLRLVPAYLIALTGCFLALQLSGYAPTDAPKFNAISTPLPLSYLASLFYQHNMILGAASRILPPLWSLEIEFQFYLVAPFLLTWYARADVVRRRSAAVIFILLGIAVATLPGLAHLLGSRLSLSLLGYIHFFGAGILASDIMFTRKPALSVWGDVLCVAGFATLLAISTFVPHDPFQGALRETGLLAGVLATYWGGMLGRHASKFLAAAAVSVIGGACYSIYLVHVPIIQAWSELVKRVAPPPASLAESWLLMLPAIPVALAAGLVFFALIEHPTMKPDWPQRLSQRLVLLWQRLGLRGRQADRAQ
jgi:peptidoglycan/LPS O-acetylase OafA/YrhL